MRIQHLRFDIWLCLCIGVLVSLGTAKIVELVTPKMYEEYSEEHTVEDGLVGGIADSSVYPAQSIDDLLSHDTFTVVSKGIQYRNRGGGYHGNYYFQALTLPSGEIIAAKINEESVTHTKSDIYTGDSILPVGKVVYEDLTEDTYFLHQIEYKEKLTRTDFYIDMLGNGGKMSEEDYTELPKMIVQVLTVFLVFPITHMAGSKLGIFPYFFEPREKKEK